jgi:hypothetical protein
MDVDLEELWQAVRCRFRHKRSPFDHVRWLLYQLLYKLTRRLFEWGTSW